MKLKCPQCEVESDFPDGTVGVVECPFCGESFAAGGVSAGVATAPSPTHDAEAASPPFGSADGSSTSSSTNNASTPAVCPICCCEIAEGDAVTICPDCKTPHHTECWEENRGCSTYGCASAAHQETHQGPSSAPGDAPATGMVACPACGAMHPASDLVCSACGKLLGNDLPSHSAGTKLRQTAEKLGSNAKTHLWPRLCRNFRLLGHDIATVFRLWWGEFSRYAMFSGKTNRRGFLAFSLVNDGICYILFRTDAGVLLGIYNLAILLPSLAVSVRRLRDTDISPWMFFALPILPLLLLVPSVPADESHR